MPELSSSSTNPSQKHRFDSVYIASFVVCAPLHAVDSFHAFADASEDGPGGVIAKQSVPLHGSLQLQIQLTCSLHANLESM